MTNDGAAKVRCGCRKGILDRNVKDYRKQKLSYWWEFVKLQKYDIETPLDRDISFGSQGRGIDTGSSTIV